MKMIPLRQLVREPIKVKRWTRLGQTVRVTDNGRPLWLLRADPASLGGTSNKKEIESELEELLRETRSNLSLSEIIKESRR